MAVPNLIKNEFRVVPVNCELAVNRPEDAPEGVGWTGQGCSGQAGVKNALNSIMARLQIVQCRP